LLSFLGGNGLNGGLLALGLLAAAVGVVLFRLHLTLRIDLENRTYEWQRLLFLTVVRSTGSLDGCHLVAEESMAMTPMQDAFKRGLIRTVSFQADKNKLKFLLFRSDESPQPQWLRTLGQEYGIPVEIGSGSMRQTLGLTELFPVLTTQPPRHVREETPDRLRISPVAHARGADKVPLVGVGLLLFVSGASVFSLNGWADILQFLFMHGFLHPVILGLGAVGMLGWLASEWIVERPDTLLEFEEGNLALIHERADGGRKKVFVKPAGEVRAFMLESGSLASAPDLFMAPRSGFRSRRILYGHDEATIQWVANWLSEKAAGVPAATPKPVRKTSPFIKFGLGVAIVAGLYAIFVLFGVLVPHT